MAKTKKEIAKVRKAQNQRAEQRKKAQGLRRFTLYVPESVIEAAKEQDLTRIGLIFAEAGADKTPLTLIKKTDGSLAEMAYAPTLLDVIRTDGQSK